MNPRDLAAYAYHNCEFAEALKILDSCAADAPSHIIRIKAWCELDANERAVEEAELACEAFPSCGELHYQRGVACLLARCAKSEVVAAFFTAIELSCSAGHVGLAFATLADHRFDESLRQLAMATALEPELEHVRLLLSYTIRASSGEFTAARLDLEQAERVLRRRPSLLRHFWGQLCWVRYYRAIGRFETAELLVARLLDQCDPDAMPRLYRNVLEAKRLIEARRPNPEIWQSPEKGPVAIAAFSAITRKPMLHSLYRYLMGRGERGANKEDIASEVWEERYNPMIHDDRIYKTVSRLRKLLGDDLHAPRFLTQSGRAYVLNLPDVPDLAGVKP